VPENMLVEPKMPRDAGGLRDRIRPVCWASGDWPAMCDS